jgi:hypothetical protein
MYVRPCVFQRVVSQLGVPSGPPRRPRDPRWTGWSHNTQMIRAKSDGDKLSRLRARMEERAREAVLRGTQWLTSTEGELVQWKEQGLIFAISREGKDLFPRYALSDDHRPLPVLADILVVLSEYSSEHLAGWFESTSAFLGGGRPREILATDPERVPAELHEAMVAGTG